MEYEVSRSFFLCFRPRTSVFETCQQAFRNKAPQACRNRTPFEKIKTPKEKIITPFHRERIGVLFPVFFQMSFGGSVFRVFIFKNRGVFSAELFLVSLYASLRHAGYEPRCEEAKNKVKNDKYDYGVYHIYSQSMKRSSRGLRKSMGMLPRRFSTLTSSNPRKASMNVLFLLV